MNLREYKNRNGASILAAHLTTVEELKDAYNQYLKYNGAYTLKGDVLYRADKAVALNDYLVLREGDIPFTEVDGMFRTTYYPADFTEQQKTKWLCAPTLVLISYDTAEDAVNYLASLGDGE